MAFRPRGSAEHGLRGVDRIRLYRWACALAYSQMRKFVRKPKEKMFWWYDHLGNFIGSYIAAWSAFSVVTLPRWCWCNRMLWLWIWLWPTPVGAPAIVLDYPVLQAQVQAAGAAYRRPRQCA